jgi:hypothetical protein
MIDELWKYEFDFRGGDRYYGVYVRSILIVHKRYAVPKMQWKFFCRSTSRGFDETCRSCRIIGETTNSKVSPQGTEMYVSYSDSLHTLTVLENPVSCM